MLGWFTIHELKAISIFRHVITLHLTHYQATRNEAEVE